MDADFLSQKDKLLIPMGRHVTANKCIIVHGANLLLQDMIYLKARGQETSLLILVEKKERGVGARSATVVVI